MPVATKPFLFKHGCCDPHIHYGYCGDTVSLESPQYSGTWVEARNHTRGCQVWVTNACLSDSFDHKVLASPWLNEDSTKWYKKKGRVQGALALLSRVEATEGKPYDLLLSEAETQQEIDGVIQALEAVVNSDAWYFCTRSHPVQVVWALARTKEFLTKLQFDNTRRN